MKTIDKIYSIAFVLILLLILLGMPLSYLTSRNISSDPVNSISLTHEYKEMNWGELYPFEDTSDINESLQIASDTNNATNNTIIDPITSKILKLEETVDYYTQNKILFHDSFLAQANLIEKKLDLPKAVGLKDSEIIYMNNGYLTYSVDELEDEDIEEIADSISNFYNYLSSNDIDFLYINAGEKPNPRDKQLSQVNQLIEYSNENGSNLLDRLENKNVPYLDLRDELIASNKDWYSAYYIGDHHWKVETAFWAAGVIANHLNNNYNYHFSNFYFQAENYEKKLYEGVLLGTQAWNLQDKSYAEDIEYLIPNFETNFHLEVPSRCVDYNGEYNETLISSSIMNYLEYYPADLLLEEFHPYQDIVNIKNDALIHITNLNPNNNEGKKILFIQDSFSWYLDSFLANDITFIDTIYLQEYDGSVRAYIEQTQPDMVIVIYSQSKIKKIDWSTHFSSFDFR